MKPDLTEVITTLMQSYDEYDDESIIKAIKSLSTNWPSLTGEERTEINAVAKAFEIMSEDTYDEEDEDDFECQETEEDLPTNRTYYNSESSYPKTIEEPQKRGLFRRRKQ